jgi:hypothetical protein
MCVIQVLTISPSAHGPYVLTSNEPAHYRGGHDGRYVWETGPRNWLIAFFFLIKTRRCDSSLPELARASSRIAVGLFYSIA